MTAGEIVKTLIEMLANYSSTMLETNVESIELVPDEPVQFKFKLKKTGQ